MHDDTIFKAIAHPARRKILSRLAVRDQSVKELTAAFSISQPAVSQHLRELKEAQLVASRKVGLEQRYRITGQPLKVIFDWSAGYRQFFDPAGHAWSFAQLGSSASKKGAGRGR